VQQARGAFRKFATDHELDVGDAARFMAMVGVSYADGLIACFDAEIAKKTAHHVLAHNFKPSNG
jgi:hypothetical protein